MTQQGTGAAQSLDIVITSHEQRSADIPKKIQVLDADLSLLDTNWVKSGSARLYLAPGIYVIRLVLSSGKEQQKVVEIVNGKNSNMYFNLGDYSPRESQEWMYFSKSSAGVNPESRDSRKERGHKTVLTGISARLWTYNPIPKDWEAANDAVILNASIDEVGMTYDLNTTGEKLQLLQITGNNFPGRHVCLPPGYNIKCLIRLATGPEKVVHPLDITVATGNTTTETLLSLITSGRIDSARSFCNSELAEELLYGKTDDPSAAAIGAYYLLKIGELKRLHNWSRNLANWITWLPDGSIIHAWQLIQQGNDSPAVIDQIRTRLLEAVDRGVPVYTEGLRLLYEGLTMLWFSFNKEDNQVSSTMRRVKKYMEAADMSQETVTFSGASPDQPGYESLGTLTGRWNELYTGANANALNI